MAEQWPLNGACGACGRPSIGFPSGRWEHVGVPCRARSRSMWRVDDVPIKQSVRFVPEGEPLPPGPDESHWHPAETSEAGVPVALAWCRGGCIHSVREALAAEAEDRERNATLSEGLKGQHG